MANVRVTVSAFVKPFAAGLGAAKSAAAKFGSSVKSFFGSIGGQIASALTVAGIARFTKSLIDAGDAIDKGSKRIQTSAEDYQKLAFAARRSGAEVGNVEAAFKGMSRVLDDAKSGMATANETLGKLGLTLADVSGKSPYETFLLVARALNEVEDANEKAAVAAEVFGRSGAALIPMLGSVESLGEELAAMGGIMSQEATEAAATLADQMLDLKTVMTAIATDGGLLQFLTGVVGGLNEVMKSAESAKMVWLDVFGTVNKYNPAFALAARKARQELARMEAEQIDRANPSIEITPAAVAERQKKSADERAAAEKRAEERAKTAAEMAAKQIKEKADREASVDKAKRDRLQEYLNSLDEELRIEQMIAAGKERQATIEKELLNARRQALAAGVQLTAEQEAQIAAAAGAIFDLKQKTEEPAAMASAAPPPVEQREFTALQRAGANLPGQQIQSISVAKQSLRRLESIDKAISYIASNNTQGTAIWP